MVPTPDGSMPRAEFPDTLMHLLVAGNESLDRQNRNTWSKAKSIALLREYGDDDEGTDTESETSALARDRRIRLAAMLGISKAQYNLSMLAL